MANPFSKVEYLDHLVLARLLKGNRRGSGNNYIVLKDYSVRYWRKADDQDGDGTTVTVPTGMVTDLASVPEAVRSFFSVTGRHTEAAIVHDYLYLYQPHDDGVTHGLDRDEADYLFRILMKAANVSYGDRLKGYMAVHLFGKGVYADRNDIRNVREEHPVPELEEERIRMFEQWAPLMDMMAQTDWPTQAPQLPGKSPFTMEDDEPTEAETNEFMMPQR